jgi:hypothetical protein
MLVRFPGGAWTVHDDLSAMEQVRPLQARQSATASKLQSRRGDSNP